MAIEKAQLLGMSELSKGLKGQLVKGVWERLQEHLWQLRRLSYWECHSGRVYHTKCVHNADTVI